MHIKFDKIYLIYKMLIHTLLLKHYIRYQREYDYLKKCEKNYNIFTNYLKFNGYLNIHLK